MGKRLPYIFSGFLMELQNETKKISYSAKIESASFGMAQIFKDYIS